MNTTAARLDSNTERSSLIRLYLSRGVLAVGWAIAFSAAHDTLNAVAVTLLVVYPLIDAVSSLIDFLAVPEGSERRLTAVNGTLSAVIAIALGIAGTAGSAAAVLGAFGAWAVMSGAAQLAVGIYRRGPAWGNQWPTLISGGLSFLVGATYIAQATGDSPALNVLAIYATGGGVFFIVQAALLAWKHRTH
ncbi:DUF308 domain-containing protein [Nocardia otitidiscaviarum]|uniref:hypothetical protein n=1 Tax=Nocardia otitidiscaviarum TaxID=1823 RepID=UPI0004A6C956|nr:hypothetical protein [Nocardia otitidiscaviarum]MBF6132089.1 DUF308 domain-containing protein [Nocardia otitidiscaviarum]MBF6483219.1 DUF308 domain-containing protein [Nocardia otitidiscaviarum]